MVGGTVGVLTQIISPSFVWANLHFAGQKGELGEQGQTGSSGFPGMKGARGFKGALASVGHICTCVPD